MKIIYLKCMFKSASNLFCGKFQDNLRQIQIRFIPKWYQAGSKDVNWPLYLKMFLILTVKIDNIILTSTLSEGIVKCQNVINVNFKL